MVAVAVKMAIPMLGLVVLLGIFIHQVQGALEPSG
jgi:hypothetical protein